MATRKKSQSAPAKPVEQEEQTAPEVKQEPIPEPDEFANLPNPCVYCGPSVRGVARQYTTFQGGIPLELKEFVKKHPMAKRLIVSTGKFANVRRQLETPGTAEANIFKSLKAEIQ